MIKFIVNRIKSFVPAAKGLFWLFNNEANAQVHLMATVVVILAGFYFKIGTTDWLFLCFADRYFGDGLQSAFGGVAALTL